MKKDYTIAVAGTGYVGLSIATLLSQHHKVMAVDIVKEKVDLINNRKSPIQDNYIEKYLAEKELNLTATLDEGGDAEKSIRPIDKKELVDKYKITKPYFLYIGTLQPRKNIETIVDAFERLNNSNVQLVLAGGIGWGMEDTLNKIKLSNCSNNIILTGYISEAEKAALCYLRYGYGRSGRLN